MKSYKLKWIKDIKRSDYVVELEYRKGMAYNEILMLAMKREEKALKLYNDFLKQAETPESQERMSERVPTPASVSMCCR